MYVYDKNITLFINIITSITLYYITNIILYFRHIKIGEEFCNSKSEQLQNDTKKSCINYFYRYHKNCLDELTIFFENESWTPCPVKREFNLFQLQVRKKILMT